MRRFAYSLALKLGEVNVDRMLSKINGKQLLEWMAFSELEPFGPRREDERAGVIVKAIYDVNRKKGSKPAKLEDCTPMFGDVPKPKKSWQAMMAFAQDYTIRSKIEADKKARQKKREG